ncbi:hypothetical protein TAMA11512_23400 [Selenomonas sp. TAMA-11512]|uniref:TRAP transporter large permease n=1 Tax=Selenomonas sp. TAMA-11512 TaxID=3095337 RepID=UPI00308AD923|nr:hypothetical protein TAMA11512_23400 [Selenomonas sp. TAMA-11512]
METALVLMGTLILGLMLNLPIGFAIGFSSIAAILVDGRLSNLYIVQQMVTASDSFTLIAIPLFILAGELMAAGGVSKRLLGVANAFFGHYTGGLATVTIVLCMFFAAVSGSGPATVAAIGTMVVPTMLEKGYDKSFTLALIACAGSIGVIIPPSIPMVIYGTTTGTSVSSVFTAGIIPGILIGFSLIVMCYFISRKNGWKGDDNRYTTAEKMKFVWEAKWALINPFIILGGIYAGVFTPTEAAAVATIYAFVCGMFIYRELNIRSLWTSLASASMTTGTILVIVAFATAFTKILTINRIPDMITHGILGLSDSMVVIILFMILLLLFVGCFMDTTPAMMVLAPILLPVAVALGLSPVHFGVIMVVTLAIGFFTPPLGVNLFVASRVGNVRMETVIAGVTRFVIIMIVDAVLIAFIPEISMFLVNLGK